MIVIGKPIAIISNMAGLKRNLSKIILVIALIIGSRYVQDIQDEIKLIDYQAPPQIARLATATTMTDTARRLFYVNTPQLETQKSALNLCQSSEHTVILGCYVGGKGIFLQAVADPRLQGIVEVTAAHEMLHVAYERLSLSEQKQLNLELRSAFSQIKSKRIKDLIEIYNSQDPAVVNTELHSILGTEVRNLSPELETHYRRYFRARQSVVAFSARYEQVFSALRDKAKNLNQQLANRKFTMEQLGKQVEQEVTNVESERAQLKRSLSINPQSNYNNQVASFNDRVQNYNRLVTELKQQTNTYNQMVIEHNSLALEEKSLVESLKSQSLPPTAR